MLSIIIPTLHEARNLARLLPLLLATCPQAEVIVVDGASVDETHDVVCQFPRVRFFTSGRGRAKQMNAGAQAAQGDVLLFLHADTVLPPGAQAALRTALADPRVVGGRFDVRFDRERPIFRVIAALMNLRSRLSGIATGDQAIFVRQQVFWTIGGYPDIPLMEDIEFTRRLKRRGRLACLRARVTTSTRKWEGDGVLRTILLMWILRLLFFVGADPGWLHTVYYRGSAANHPAAPLGALREAVVSSWRRRRGVTHTCGNFGSTGQEEPDASLMGTPVIVGERMACGHPVPPRRRRSDAPVGHSQPFGAGGPTHPHGHPGVQHE